MALDTSARLERAPTPELLSLVANRFRALAEPARLSILHALEPGERTVTELVERTGLSQGNLSKHLQQLHSAGFVSRRRHGLFVYYTLADERVLALCALMCDRLEDDLNAVQRVISGER
jgi:DNA-binding transcriptional ArsR family regulator